MKFKMKNQNLNKARKNKNDEFYTFYEDIETEINSYNPEIFKNKIIYCNQDSSKSNFYKFFKDKFFELNLKELRQTCIKNEYQEAEYIRFNGIEEINKPLENGSFDSWECLDILNESDIVITNPPFSLFRKLFDILTKMNKDFLVIGNLNQVQYVDVFNRIKNNEVLISDERLKKFFFEDTVTKFGNILWFGTLPKKFNKPLELKSMEYNKEHFDNVENLYVKYDNYDQIEVPKVQLIPSDYDGIMGVPITFLEKYNPEQFEIVGLAERSHGQIYPNKLYKNPYKFTLNKEKYKETRINDQPQILFEKEPSHPYFISECAEGYLKSTYRRILIEHKQ